MNKLALYSSLALLLASQTVNAAMYTPAPVPEPEIKNFYIGAFGGVAFTQDMDFDEHEHHVDIDFDSVNYHVGAHLGYRVYDYLNLEAEYIFMHSNADCTNVYSTADSSLNGMHGGGDADVNAVMFNGLFRFDDVNDVFIPFVGVGIGYAHVDIDCVSAPNGVSVISGDDGGFAYQILAGVGFKVADNVLASLSYRYFATTDLSFDGSTSTSVGKHYDLCDNFRNHLISIGIDAYVA